MSRIVARFWRFIEEENSLLREEAPCEHAKSAALCRSLLQQVAESTFRRLKGAELLPAVYAGAQYVNGVPRIVKTQQRFAA
ncbi:MAG: hypothetical protein HY268_26500 [Deltaproteobacteria bacterium]|nr:hypothetical protein [Deltaproteobacteria bacterium]